MKNFRIILQRTVEIISYAVNTHRKGYSINAYNYLLKAGEFYKIGITNISIESRIAQLQTGCPFKIESVHYSNCKNPTLSRSIEKYLHTTFSKVRAEGEWFRLTPTMVNEAIVYIKCLSREGNLSTIQRIDKEIRANTPTTTKYKKTFPKNL